MCGCVLRVVGHGELELLGPVLGSHAIAHDEEGKDIILGRCAEIRGGGNKKMQMIMSKHSISNHKHTHTPSESRIVFRCS